MTDVISVDFETRSATDIRLGVERYSKDPECDALMLAFRIPGAAQPFVWHRGPHLNEIDSERERQLQVLLDMVADGAWIRAWNVGFEYAIWNNVCVPKYGWPPLRLEQCVDTMALAAAMNLPQGLGRCAAVLGLPSDQQKDKRGKHLIQRLCVPHPPTKTRAGKWVEDRALFEEFVSYCGRDVVVEEAIARRLRPLSEHERKVWLATQRMNGRGVPVAVDEVRNILTVVEAEKERLNRELRKVTGRRVLKATDRNGLLAWVNERGLSIDFDEPVEADEESMPDMRAGTVEAVLKRDDLPADVRRALEIRAAVVQTSTAKFSRMLKIAADDGTLKNLLVYHGAGTGRWASRGGLNCFTGDVEVLTPGGWTRFDNWSGEPIMQWWPDGRLTFCERPVQTCREYVGAVIDVSGPMFDATMTPDHRLVFFREGKYRETTAGAAAVNDRLGGVPMSGIWQGAEKSLFTPDEARLMVAIAADGCRKERVTHRGTVEFGFRKFRKVARLTALLDRLGLKYRASEYPAQEGHKGGHSTVRFFLPDCPYPKGFGPWLLQLSREALDAVVDEIPYWDGWRHHKNDALEFCSSLEDQAAWVSTALHLSGTGGTVRKYVKADGGVRYQVHARQPGSRTAVAPGGFKTRSHSGLVFCASVESSYILIRRNNKIVVTGQCQNFARPALLVNEKKGLDDIANAHEILGAGDHAAALLLWGDDVMDAAVSCLRGVIKAPEGYDFINADYSNVEVRVAAWLAGQDDLVEAFRGGLDPYKLFAVDMFKVTYEQVTKDQRQFSKGPVIGGVFSLGPAGLQDYAVNYGVSMSLDEATVATKTLRKKWDRIPATWYACSDAAINAVRNPGEWFPAGDKLRLMVHKNFLWMKLPSGRLLAWSSPEIEMQEAPWTEKYTGHDENGNKVTLERPAIRPVVVVESIETKTRQWCRHKLIGSSIFQSATQATARDILAQGFLNVEEAGYPVVFMAHDELMACVPEGFGSVDEFGRLMCKAEGWYADLPLAFEGYRARRFKK